MRIIVIGCGVVGSFVGYFLKKHGIDVTCISRWKKFPHVSLIQSIMQKFEEDIEMAHRSRIIYEEVSRELNVDQCISRVHSYTIISYKSLDKVNYLSELWRRYGISIRFVDEKDLKKMSFKVYDNELVFEGYPDYLIRIDKIVRSLWRELNVIRGEARLRLRDNRIVVTTERGNMFTGDYIVVACGAYTRSLLRDVNVKLPLVPYKCQAGLFVLKTDRSDYILYDYVNRIYVRPADNVMINLVNRASPRRKFMISGNGNSPPLEPDEKEKSVDDYFKREVTERLRRRYDYVKYVTGRADFCDTTPDARPLIAVIGNLVVVSGFNGYGVEIGPAVAKAVAKIILGDKLDEYEKRYLSSRFGEIKDVGKLPEVEAHEL